MFGMFSIDASEGMREQKTANDTRRVAIEKKPLRIFAEITRMQLR